MEVRNSDEYGNSEKKKTIPLYSIPSGRRNFQYKKSGVPPLLPISIYTFAKAYGIFFIKKKGCYWEHVGEHSENHIGNVMRTH